MKIIAAIAQKGGSGKTTLAIHLATAFSAEGKATLLLDLDPQTSATEWRDHRATDTPEVMSIQPSRLPRFVDQAREIGTEILILDTAPHSEATALDAARMADLILVPCQPTIMDLRALRKTADLLRLVNRTGAFAILNSVPHQGSVADEAAETITQDYGLPVAPVRLGDRVAYSRCMIEGQAAQELEPDGKAAREVAQLLAWVKAQLAIHTDTTNRESAP